MIGRLQVSAFGPFRVLVDDVELTGLSVAKQRALIAYLASDPQRVHSRSHLASLLWSEVIESRSKQSLREALYRVRKTIDVSDVGARTADGNEVGVGQAVDLTSVLVVDRQSVRFARPDLVDSDVSRFLSLIEQTKSHVHSDADGANCHACVASLREAADLYRGEYLEGLAIDDAPLFDDWLVLQREQLKNQAFGLLQRLVDSYQLRREFDEAIHIAFRLITLDPYREPSHQAVMRTLALQGLQDRALAHYAQFRALLLDEIGIPPSPQTDLLAAEIEDGELSHSQVTGPPSADQTAEAPPTLHDPHDPSADDSVSSPEQSALVSLTRNPDFVGRESELSTLANLLVATDAHALSAVVVSGSEGIGKSELVLEFAHRYRRHFRGGVRWLDLGGVDEVEREITPTSDESALIDLRQEDETRLLIVDGCDDYQRALQTIPAETNTSVLFTSRRSSWPDDFPGTEVHVTGSPRRHEILVVDDVAANLAVLTEILQGDAYEVRPAINGPIALTAIAAAPPDLILLDINMPKMTGIEVCSTLKQDERFRDIPIIFISALSETADKAAALKAGGVDYITKPFQAEEVVARVGLHLRLHGAPGRVGRTPIR